jgi:hypothetical protein
MKVRAIFVFVAMLYLVGCMNSQEYQVRMEQIRKQQQIAARNWEVCQEMLPQDRFHCAQYERKVRFYQCLEMNGGNEGFCERYNRP